MKLKRRGSTSEEWRLIGGFREDGVGYRVVKTDGRDLGYFGPDRYKSIIFESKAVASGKKALDKNEADSAQVPISRQPQRSPTPSGEGTGK